MGGAELAGQLELARVEVDGDDRGGSGQARAGDGCTAHTAAAEHGHRVARTDLPGEHGRPEPAITPHPSRPTASGRAAGSTLVH